MNACVYIGIVMFAIGLFTWLFATSRLRNSRSSLVPVSPSRISLIQILNIVGWILFIGGLAMSVIAAFC